MKSAMPYRGVPAPVPAARCCVRCSRTTRCRTRRTWQATVLELWDGGAVPRGALRRPRAGPAPALPRAPAGAHAGPLRAPRPHRRLVGPRRRDRHAPRARGAARPTRAGGARWCGTWSESPRTSGCVVRRSSARSARGDASATRSCWPRRSRPTSTARRGPRPPVSPYGRGVLRPQGDRLGPARPRPHRPRLGGAASCATHADAALRPLAARGAQAPASRGSAVEVADPGRGPPGQLAAVVAEHLLQHPVLLGRRRCRRRRCASRRPAPTAATSPSVAAM